MEIVILILAFLLTWLLNRLFLLMAIKVMGLNTTVRKYWVDFTNDENPFAFLIAVYLLIVLFLALSITLAAINNTFFHFKYLMT